MAQSTSWIDAKTAATLLGVSRSTLYAYVSRGFVRSQSAEGVSREKRYAREDVDRLMKRAGERRHPEAAAARTMQGLPVIESAITLVSGGRLYYRGHDAIELARTRSIAEVAALLWNGSFDPAFVDTPLHVISGRAIAEDLPFVSRSQSVLPLVGARDPLAFDLRPKGVAQTGWRILNLLASVAAESSELEETIEDTLARRWETRSRLAPAVLRAAMIVSADHELNVSAFTARCVASAGSSPYAVIGAALAALEGSKRGGVTLRVATLFEELRRERNLERALAERLRRGEPLDGFGHPLHPEGDPRALLLLEMLPPSKEHEFARALV
jgi:citrate synthase